MENVICQLEEITNLISSVESKISNFVSENLTTIINNVIGMNGGNVSVDGDDYHISLGGDFTGMFADGDAITVYELVFNQETNTTYCMCEESDDLVDFNDLAPDFRMNIINILMENF